jgi:phosphoribosyl-ATP pyrophosphohydrolase
MASKEKLQDIMAKYGEEVIVHVLGFSEQHNDAFLKELSLLVSFHYLLLFSKNSMLIFLFSNIFLPEINSN